MIYIACPSNCFTGGPTLLHQLCHELNDAGYSASMAYYEGVGSEPGPLAHPRYEEYGCEYTRLDEVGDCSGHWLVLPETGVRLASGYKNLKVVIWWLSVDNYILGNIGIFDKIANRLVKDGDTARFIRTDSLKKRKEFFSPLYYHLSQSYYATQFLMSTGVPADRIFYLSDYIDDTILLNAMDESLEAKRDVVLYNPKKMGRLTRLLLDTELAKIVVPLQDMSREELVATMRRAKLYLDFGNHPGKDRLPREAAACGCCVVTGLRGSAGNDIDVPIPNKYKISDGAEIGDLINLIEHILRDYDVLRTEFDDYRKYIWSEHGRFRTDLAEVCNAIFQRGIVDGR